VKATRIAGNQKGNTNQWANCQQMPPSHVWGGRRVAKTKNAARRSQTSWSLPLLGVLGALSVLGETSHPFFSIQLLAADPDSGWQSSLGCVGSLFANDLTAIQAGGTT